MCPFPTPGKHKQTFDFQIFSGGIERVHWLDLVTLCVLIFISENKKMLSSNQESFPNLATNINRS